MQHSHTAILWMFMSTNKQKDEEEDESQRSWCGCFFCFFYSFRGIQHIIHQSRSSERKDVCKFYLDKTSYESCRKPSGSHKLQIRKFFYFQKCQTICDLIDISHENTCCISSFILVLTYFSPIRVQTLAESAVQKEQIIYIYKTLEQQ